VELVVQQIFQQKRDFCNPERKWWMIFSENPNLFFSPSFRKWWIYKELYNEPQKYGGTVGI
jgi:hypothetical protein